MVPSLKRISVIIVLLAVCLCAMLVMLIPNSARSADEEFSTITLTADMNKGIPGDRVMFVVTFHIYDYYYNNWDYGEYGVGWDEVDDLLRQVRIGKNVATSTSLVPVEDYEYDTDIYLYEYLMYAPGEAGKGVYLYDGYYDLCEYRFRVAFWLGKGENFVIYAPEGVDIRIEQDHLSFAGAQYTTNLNASGGVHISNMPSYDSFDIFIEGDSTTSSDGYHYAKRYQAGDPVNISFENIIYTAISVTKNGDADPSEEFEFTIKDIIGYGSHLVDRWGFNYYYSDMPMNDWLYYSGLGGRVTDAGRGEFTLKNNETITFFKIPPPPLPPLPSSPGTPASIVLPSIYTAADETYSGFSIVASAQSLPDYRITEIPAHGYITTNTLDGVAGANPHFTNAIRTGNGRNDVIFTNANPKGVLEVSKTLSGNNTEANREFNFTVTFDAGGTYEAEYSNGGIFNITSGDTFKLKGDEFVVITGIPTGTKYSVSETDANSNGYTTTPSSGELTGTISEELSEAKFTNIRSTTGTVVDPTPPTTPTPTPTPTPSPAPSPTTTPDAGPPPPSDSGPPPPPNDPPPPPDDPEPWEPLDPEPEPEPPPSTDPWIELDDDGTPLGRWEYDPETETWIFIPFPPLADLPQTGKDSSIPFLLLGFGVFLVCTGYIVVAKYRQRRLLFMDF